MIFRQLFDSETSTYTYILADSDEKEGVIIDPVIENLDRDLQTIQELGIKLKWILDTHVHADHITAAYAIKEKTGAKIGMGVGTNVSCADRLFKEGEEVTFGDYQLKVIATPGHTNGCTSYYLKDYCVFTGDTLLIRGCGRTDFQEGSSESLFDNVREKLFKLPDSTLVYPAHDYKGRMSSSIGEEKQFNPRLKLSNSKDQFVDMMSNLNLDEPKNMHKAVPANVNCGKV
ncbi:MAG: MBL fold metallo-hydrolase [Proteobacteria bacterium]|jgi:sulfur dioxygenase|nr:MBL fold metallo-hydrolase [Pseudomonadota bacterium]